MATYYLKQGDRSPIIETTLLNPDGSVFDLSGAVSAKIRVKKPNASTYLVETAATISNPAGGVVEYQFDAVSTDVPGFYLVEWVIDEGLASEETFPNYGYDALYIERKL